MEHKDDWDLAKSRFLAWWHGGADGVALGVTAPLDQPREGAPWPEKPAGIEGEWLDAEYRAAAAEARFARTFYGGAIFPLFNTWLGPGSLALHLGAEPEWADDTVWFHPGLTTLAAPPHLAFDPAERWWRASLRIVAEGVRRGKGRFLTCIPDLLENLDVLAALRGPQELLTDLVDYPENVHPAQRQVLEAYFACYDAVCPLVAADWGGTCFSPFPIWGPGRVAKLQCDFSAMISPRMFEEFVAPYLAEQCERLDFTVYHLDGPNALCHLDTLLSIPRLNAIQWMPGAGQPGAGAPRWHDVYRRIRRAGKGVYIPWIDAREVEPLLDAIGGEGVLIQTHVGSEREAREMLARVE